VRDRTREPLPTLRPRLNPCPRDDYHIDAYLSLRIAFITSCGRCAARVWQLVRILGVAVGNREQKLARDIAQGNCAATEPVIFTREEVPWRLECEKKSVLGYERGRIVDLD
jgi:hypothetical protein